LNTGFVHVGAWSPLLDDYVCVTCGVMFTMAAWYDCDHGGDCPGQVTPASGGVPGG
jgi:hypothetical protein